MDARTLLMLRQSGRTATAPTATAAVPETTCCTPCEDKGFCREDTNCCLECHFSYEVAKAFPYLPLTVQRELQEQHVWLAANDYPTEELEAHAEYEMQFFRRFCPPDVVAQIDADHREISRGQMPSSDDPPA